MLTATEFAGIAGAAGDLSTSRATSSFRLCSSPSSSSCCGSTTRSSSASSSLSPLVYLSYIASAILAKPNWNAPARGTLIPTFELRTPGWLTTVVALIGTTISPYMQFFLQSAVVDKGTRTDELGLARADVINGSVLAIALAGFMIIASAATKLSQLTSTADTSQPGRRSGFRGRTQTLAGDLAAYIFAFGILNTSIFAATVLPLSTAYVVLRSLRVRGGRRPEVQRSAGLLFSLVRRRSGYRRRHRADSRGTAAQLDLPGAGDSRGCCCPPNSC